MDAGDLQDGFRLGDWVVEPQAGRIATREESRSLAPHLIRILLLLAERHGELVSREDLRERGWPGERTSGEALVAAIEELRQALGDSAQDPGYIVASGMRGYALVAHVDPLPRSAAPPVSASARGEAGVRGLAARAHALASEMRRRQVFKVLGAYFVGMWLVLQVAQTTFAPLHFPEWWMTALTILAVTGIPIVGMLAWSYEITPAGIVRDPADRGGVALPRPRRAIAPFLVTGVALMAGVTAVAWWRSIGQDQGTVDRAVHAPPRSIAVLPLVDMTPGGTSGYLGDGLSEELSAQLAQIPGLRVAARTSAFEFKGKSVDVRRIGAALGVSHVLEGSVRRDGDRLRVTAQLIDTSNGYHVWAETYDRDWSDVIAIQDDIARAITQALEVVLTPEAARRLSRGNVGNLQAYDSYLAGMSALHRSGDLSQLDAARDLFRKALAADPGLSRAYAGLCEAGIRRYDRTRSPADVAEAEGACRKALELDPSREETELALGRLYRTSGRYEQAEATYRNLVARRPRDADVYIGLGWALDGEGQKPAAEQAFRKAVAVEPGYWGAHSALGLFLFGSGRAGDAVAELRRTTELVPESASAFSNLGAALMLAVRLKEAANAFERSLAIAPSRSAQANLGTLYYLLGNYPLAVQHYKSAELLASQDPSIIGNCADALWQMPSRREEAHAEYRRAIELAQDALKVNPSDAVTWAQLAYYSDRNGDREQATRAQARAEALGDDNMYVHYYLALIAADRGDAAAASAHLHRAEQLGYPRELLAVDPVARPFVSREK
ncbi:MAG TPA: tetratricopeptide repeat protein, partial [Casimicrobiaceae bacterium]|nr:tetratricopeptide repeat protein [Casimicrobiaceae bacterium]